MDKFVKLAKKDFNEFVVELAKEKTVVAPTDKGFDQYSFTQVTSGDEISQNYKPTILPPKKYFLPQKENIVCYEKDKSEWQAVLEYEDLILFLANRCQDRSLGGCLDFCQHLLLRLLCGC